MPTQHKHDDMDTRDDIALVQATKQGDSSAFEALVHRYTPMVYRVVRHIMHSPEDTEDVVQEALLKAFQHLESFEARSLFSTWLTRIAVNAALMKLRSMRRVQPMSIDEEREEGGTFADKIVDWRPDPEQLYRKAELREILRQALASLPHVYRIVFFLRDIEGMSTAEAAEVLGLTIPNVKARLFRARLKLREHLSQYFETRGDLASASIRLERAVRELRAL